MFENHSQDTRYKGPLDVAQTVSATYGTGGNNQPFVVESAVVPATLKIRCGHGNGGRGALIQKNNLRLFPAITTKHFSFQKLMASAENTAIPC